MRLVGVMKISAGKTGYITFLFLFIYFYVINTKEHQFRATLRLGVLGNRLANVNNSMRELKLNSSSIGKNKYMINLQKMINDEGPFLKKRKEKRN
jgi:hypothetical protein